MKPKLKGEKIVWGRRKGEAYAWVGACAGMAAVDGTGRTGDLKPLEKNKLAWENKSVDKDDGFLGWLFFLCYLLVKYGLFRTKRKGRTFTALEWNPERGNHFYT